MGGFWAYTKVGRRRFLQIAAGSAIVLSGLPRRARAAPYVVGVGQDSNAYAATMRALLASGEWNAALLEGRTVLIKPNLVTKQRAYTGATTDPQVVCALIDSAFEAGAAHVKIIEGYPGSNNYASCGYDIFEDYNAHGPVELVDLAALPVKLVDVPGGLAYRQMYMPELLFAPNTVLVSAAKMKVHAETLVTLAVKNSFGLSPEAKYRVQAPDAVGRFAMHDRGVQQAVVDHNLVRPIDFAVVDGVWAMERMGPYGGDAVAFDTVVAGRNAVAVDRACLAAMGVAQHWPYYLTLAANKGLGPYNMDEIELRGDALPKRVFVLPDVPPVVDLPIATPAVFSLGPAQRASTQMQHAEQQTQEVEIRYAVNRHCATRIEIVQTSEETTEVIPVRLVQDWTLRAGGSYIANWDGRDDVGVAVAPGRYTARIEATHGEAARNAFATTWVTVLDAASDAVLHVAPALLTFVGNVNGALPPAQVIELSSSDPSVVWTAAASAPWLSLSADKGTGPASLTLAVDSTGRGAGTYSAQVTFTAKGSVGEETTRIVHVKMNLARAEPPETSAELVFEGEVGGTPPEAKSVTVANTGQNTLTWIVNQAPAWLSVTPLSGRTPGEIDVVANLQGVAAGTYLGQVSIANVADASTIRLASVVLRVTQPDVQQTLHLPYARRP